MDVVTLGIWAYAVLAALVAVDSLLPLVPSEATVIAATAVAAAGDLSVPGVFTAAAIGAAIGDVAVYLVGRFAGTSDIGRRIRSPRSAVARRLIERVRTLGCPAIVFGRFVPVGRTGVAALAGIHRMPARVYLPAAVAGSLAWAGYMTALGRIGGLVATGLLAQVAIGIGVGLVVLVLVGRSTRRSAGSVA